METPMTKRFLLRIVPIVCAAALVPDGRVRAQTPADFTTEFLEQFDASMQKFIALAEAMPAERYTWSPGEGVMSVARVYMHVARYNYGYPSDVLESALPGGVALNTMEDVTDKTQIVAALRASGEYVRESLRGRSAEDLSRTRTLYGRQVPEWSVYLQLVAHMNEHLGQSIAYARMNRIVPPWSN
jgi:uncharacterized damage-inducible protein DinB